MKAMFANASDYFQFERIYAVYTERCMRTGDKNVEVFDEKKFMQNVDGGILLAIDESGEPQGFAIIGGVGTDIHVSNIFGNARNNEAELVMLNLLEEVGKAEGFQRLVYWNMELTTAMDGYWHRLGFQSVNGTDEFERVI